jgi:hypothetical protein
MRYIMDLTCVHGSGATELVLLSGRNKHNSSVDGTSASLRRGTTVKYEF